MSGTTVFEYDIDTLVDACDWGFFQGARVLVTGATGIVGTYLTWTMEEARRRGYADLEVVGISHSGRFRVSLTGLPPRTIAVDLADGWSKPTIGPFDIIVYAAGYGQPGKFVSDPLSTIRVNTTGVLGSLRLLSPGGTFAFVSSSEVYSGVSGRPATEQDIGTTDPGHPRAAYIEAKRCGEAIVNSATMVSEVTGVNFRLALAYGPGAARDDSRVLYQFIRKGLIYREIELQDAGAASRTYCYVTDAVELMLNTIAARQSGTFNVGGVSRTSIRSLAEQVGLMTDARVVIPEHVESTVLGAPSDVQLDLRQILEVTKKDHFVPLEIGLARTVEWTSSQLSSGHDR